MIRYDLVCKDGHEFDSWFRDSEGYDALNASGLVSCPHCGGTKVSKAIMAPRVARAGAPAETLAQGREERRADAERQAAFAYVGKDFPEKAMAMHRGEIPEALIRGEATPDQARALLDAGVKIRPMAIDRSN